MDRRSSTDAKRQRLLAEQQRQAESQLELRAEREQARLSRGASVAERVVAMQIETAAVAEAEAEKATARAARQAAGAEARQARREELARLAQVDEQGDSSTTIETEGK